jgi:hypothetical protein
MTHSERLYIATASQEKQAFQLAAKGIMKGVGAIGSAVPFIRATAARAVRPAFTVAKGVGSSFGGDVASAARAVGQGTRSGVGAVGAEAATGGLQPLRAAADNPFVHGNMPFNRTSAQATDALMEHGSASASGLRGVAEAGQPVGTGLKSPGGISGSPGWAEKLYNFGEQGKQQLNPMIDSASREMLDKGHWGRNFISKTPTAIAGIAAAGMNPWYDAVAGVGSGVGTFVGNKQKDMTQGGVMGAAEFAHQAQNMPWQQRLGYLMNPNAIAGQLPPEVQAMMQKMYPQAQQPAGAQQPGVLDSLRSMISPDLISPNTGRGMVPGQAPQ